MTPSMIGLAVMVLGAVALAAVIAVMAVTAWTVQAADDAGIPRAEVRRRETMGAWMALAAAIIAGLAVGGIVWIAVGGAR